jgi:hypothetical protein
VASAKTIEIMAAAANGALATAAAAIVILRFANGRNQQIINNENNQ